MKMKREGLHCLLLGFAIVIVLKNLSRKPGSVLSFQQREVNDTLRTHHQPKEERTAKSEFNKLDLFVSTFPGNSNSTQVDGFSELTSTLIRSLQFFWPNDQLNVTVVLDETTISDDDGSSSQSTLPSRANRTAEVKSFFAPHVAPRVRVAYNPIVDSTTYGYGWFIQQLVMFWADNFTDAPYIGFVDDDTIFTSAIRPTDIFDDLGRPRVLVRHAKNSLRLWTEASIMALQRPVLIYAMTYFPVVIHRQHLADLRAEILRLHPEYNCFDDFFAGMVNRHGAVANMTAGAEQQQAGGLSQFYIMMDYVFHNHFDKYSWHIEGPREQFEQNFIWKEMKDHLSLSGVDNNNKNPPPGRAVVTADMVAPFPRVAIHGSYLFMAVKALRHARTIPGRESAVSNIMKTGYCYSLPLLVIDNKTTSSDPAKCQSVVRNVSKPDIRGAWRFEQYEGAWMKLDYDGVQRAHTNRMKQNLPREWDSLELQTLFGKQ